MKKTPPVIKKEHFYVYGFEEKFDYDFKQLFC